MRHTELIRSVDLNDRFVSNLNWCMPGGFSWLSGVASNWAKWKWNYLRFTYIPSASTSTQGTIALGALYDVLDAQPTSLAQTSSMAGFSSGAIWSGTEGTGYLSKMNDISSRPGAVSLLLDIQERTKRFPYITLEALGRRIGFDNPLANMYSPARVVSCVANGVANVANVGNVYATYEIELTDPITQAQNFTATPPLIPTSDEGRISELHRIVEILRGLRMPRPDIETGGPSEQVTQTSPDEGIQDPQQPARAGE